MKEREALVSMRRSRLCRMSLVLLLIAMSNALVGGESSLAASPQIRIPCGMCEEHNRFVRLQVDLDQTPEQKGAHYSHPLR